MTTTIHMPNAVKGITAVTLTTILREQGVIGAETAVVNYQKTGE